IYRENVNYGQVESVSLWVNDVGPEGKSTVLLSPIKAMPLVKAKIKNPAITIGGKRIVFPVELESGSYLEFNSPTDCKVYGPGGQLVGEVTPQGEVPELGQGANKATFTCDGPTDVNPRVRVTVISEGEAI
ncbi:MAG: hypothetical protein JXQ73_02860, partial [Phycisphaerae bacterium]|nr:hypothetical protein [Phycisphaerae bacterium]